MQVIYARNVCSALPIGLTHLLRHGIPEDSRAGPVLVSPMPVTTVYDSPRERVLFSAVRDANPFFHLAEALWMLAGRNDAGFLDRFVKDFSQRFAEPDGVQHGAYGHRWGVAFGFDQLEYVANLLGRDPRTRQAVLQMWDARIYPEGQADLVGNWQDRPCNTHAYFRLRGRVLDLTVCCRSNDIIWGAYGANAVHFSVLQEYMAAQIGAEVGTYYQISNNFHLYQAELERLLGRIGEAVSLPASLLDQRYGDLWPQPLVFDPGCFDEELAEMLNHYESVMPWSRMPRNRFLKETVWQMLMAHEAYRAKDKDALRLAGGIAAEDWRVACVEWIERRIARQADKAAQHVPEASGG